MRVMVLTRSVYGPSSIVEARAFHIVVVIGVVRISEGSPAWLGPRQTVSVGRVEMSLWTTEQRVVRALVLAAQVLRRWWRFSHNLGQRCVIHYAFRFWWRWRWWWWSVPAVWFVSLVVVAVPVVHVGARGTSVIVVPLKLFKISIQYSVYTNDLVCDILCNFS